MEENKFQTESGIIINVDMSVKSIIYVKSYYIWNPATCSCKNFKYLASIIDDDSVISYDETIEETKTIATNFNKKRATCKTLNFYMLLPVLLVTIVLLIAVSIY